MKSKTEPTQAVLGTLYDQIETAIEFVDCAYHATNADSLGVHREHTACVRAVLDEAIGRMNRIKDQVHDLVEWA